MMNKDTHIRIKKKTKRKLEKLKTDEVKSYDDVINKLFEMLKMLSRARGVKNEAK